MKCCESCAFYQGKRVCAFMNPFTFEDDPCSHWCVFYEDKQYKTNDKPSIPCKLSPDGKYILVYHTYPNKRKIPVTSIEIKDKSKTTLFHAVGILHPANSDQSYSVLKARNESLCAVIN